MLVRQPGELGRYADGIVKEMHHRSWSRLFNELDVSGDVTPVPPERLDAFESKNGIKLPASYREYCSVFGPGRLIGVISLKIVVPGEQSWPWLAELSLFNEHMASVDPIEIDEYCSEPKLWRNGLFFGDDNGNMFFWNKGEVTDNTTNEMGVYLVERSMQIHRITDTFESFVFGNCLEHSVINWSKSKKSDPAEYWAGVNGP